MACEKDIDLKRASEEALVDAIESSTLPQRYDADGASVHQFTNEDRIRMLKYLQHEEARKNSGSRLPIGQHRVIQRGL